MKPNLQTASSREIVPTPRYFDADLVVSRNATGDIRSRYGDPIWDLSSSSADGTTRAVLIFFSIDCSAEHDLALVIREQQKALMWLYKSRGPLRSLGTLLHANHALSILSEKAFERRITLFALLIDPERMSTEMESLNTTYLSVSKALIESLWRYGKELGLEVQIPLSKLKGQIASQRRSRSQNKQTPIIPSRVYCSILGRLISYLDEIERELPELLDAQRQCVAAYRALKSEGVMRKRVAYRAKMLAPVVASMKRLGYDPSCRGALDAFVVSQLALFQAALMHTIAAFSGMRVGEVSLLPLFGVEETFQDRGAVHYEIKGYTQKLEHGRKRPTSWITNREGHRAVLLAQRIASTNFELLGTPPVEGQEALLFATPKSAFRKKGSPKILKFQRRLIEMVCPVVTQVDIDELNELELSRGWQHEGIEVGKRWPLTFHQLRRSLSVYAHRSGMVSLPALKAQLQHITDEMRAYYADGYSRAVKSCLRQGALQS
ncbi:hypothetical protein LRS03_02920 [Rhizobacter sp. J219]|uniref:hypothetical protein n=1 Tax=Rhizobacter sp. J219 TaxID=2898430 RepID=UPI002150D40C|nr:hypothetical protein [Rhizobacter sp. J219]MCR5881864.1 hypothetical protein [Rhizobacter sp. J219]